MSNFRRKTLDCGSCGCVFQTWQEYQDQDQDKGFGICHECQEMAEATNNEMLDNLGNRIRDALNEKNRIKWDSFRVETKRLLAVDCIDKGLVNHLNNCTICTWSIGGSHESN